MFDNPKKQTPASFKELILVAMTTVEIVFASMCSEIGRGLRG